jgi:Cu+-exporting ATPase
MGQAGTASSTAAPGVRQIELSIGGMTCAACAARVEKTLAAIPEVIAVVNFATEKASVTAPAAVSVDHLVDVVRQAGYSAGPTRPGLIATAGAEAPAGAAEDRAA